MPDNSLKKAFKPADPYEAGRNGSSTQVIAAVYGTGSKPVVNEFAVKGAIAALKNKQPENLQALLGEATRRLRGVEAQGAVLAVVLKSGLDDDDVQLALKKATPAGIEAMYQFARKKPAVESKAAAPVVVPQKVIRIPMPKSVR